MGVMLDTVLECRCTGYGRARGREGFTEVFVREIWQDWQRMHKHSTDPDVRAFLRSTIKETERDFSPLAVDQRGEGMEVRHSFRGGASVERVLSSWRKSKQARSLLTKDRMAELREAFSQVYRARASTPEDVLLLPPPLHSSSLILPPLFVPFAEVWRVIRKSGSKKAPGPSKVSIEMIKYGGKWAGRLLTRLFVGSARRASVHRPGPRRQWFPSRSQRRGIFRGLRTTVRYR